MDNKKTVIFIGMSGSGKGTQALLFIDYLKKKNPYERVFYNETGSYFREFVEEKGFSSKLAREIMDSGGREPDFLAVWLWANAFIKNLKGDEYLIIDGTPRSLNEREMLDTALRFYKKRTVVFYLRLSKESAIERLKKRGRYDDRELTDIQERLGWFERDVLPVIESYRNSPDYKLMEIDGELSTEEIHKEIIKTF